MIVVICIFILWITAKLIDLSSLLPVDTLVAVLERDTLGVREVRLFGAAVRWAEAEAHRQQLQPTPENKRKVLGKALTLIRFPLMTIEEFAAGKQTNLHCRFTVRKHTHTYTSCASRPWALSFGLVIIPSGPAQSSILTDREVVSLFLHFTVNPKPRVDFIDRPRCCLRGKECSITRFGQVESRWGYSGTSDRIRWVRSRATAEREKFCTNSVRLFSLKTTVRQNVSQTQHCHCSWTSCLLWKKGLVHIMHVGLHTVTFPDIFLLCVFLLRFSVNRRIFVVGFGLYGSIHGPTDYQVNIQVWTRALRKFCLVPSHVVGKLYDISSLLSFSRLRSFTQTVTRCWARMIQASVVMGQPTPSESCSKNQWRSYPTSTTLPALHWRSVMCLEGFVQSLEGLINTKFQLFSMLRIHLNSYNPWKMLVSMPPQEW